MKTDMIRKGSRMYVAVEVRNSNLDFINSMIAPGSIMVDQTNTGNRLLYLYYRNAEDQSNGHPWYDDIDAYTKLFICINRPSTDGKFLLIQDGDDDIISINNRLFALADDVITAYTVINPSLDYVKNKLINKISDRIYSDQKYSLQLNLIPASNLNDTDPIATITDLSGDDEENRVLSFTKRDYIVFTYGNHTTFDPFCGIKSCTDKDLQDFVCIPKEDPITLE